MKAKVEVSSELEEKVVGVCAMNEQPTNCFFFVVVGIFVLSATKTGLIHCSISPLMRGHTPA